MAVQLKRSQIELAYCLVVVATIIIIVVVVVVVVVISLLLFCWLCLRFVSFRDGKI